jgi:hypothetical protein
MYAGVWNCIRSLKFDEGKRKSKRVENEWAEMKITHELQIVLQTRPNYPYDHIDIDG